MAMPPPELASASPAPRAPGREETRALVRGSLLSGLCPLIPLPFVDTWARDRLRGRIVAALARRHHISLSTQEIRELAGRGELTLLGCLLSALWKPIYLILRKFFREILFFLTLKDCVDTTSRTFHESYLVHAVLTGRVEARGANASEARRAIEEVCDQADPRPVEALIRHSMRGSRKMLRRLARLLPAALRARETSSGDGSEIPDLGRDGEWLDSLSAEIATELEQQEGHLERLVARLAQRLVSRGNPVTEPPPIAPSTHGT